MFDRELYRKEHDAIYSIYRAKYADRKSLLISDGVVDSEHYAGILFLLKEAYSRDQEFGEWDLAKGLADKGPWGMWHHVAKWTYGLLNTDETCIAPFRDFNWDMRNAMLRRIAVVNVKKVNGVSTSESDDLEQYVQNNTDLLRREITHVKPKIIICGGTYDFLKEIFGLKINQTCDNLYYWIDLGMGEKVLVVDYYHPAARYPEILSYYGLVNIYQQALINNH